MGTSPIWALPGNFPMAYGALVTPESGFFMKGVIMNQGNVRWFTVGDEELQAGSYSEAVKIVKRRKVFKKRQKGKENGKNN